MARKHSSSFAVFARGVASASGHPAAFLVAVGSIVAWALAGPVFGFSDTWQLVVNTATTVITFLMVFLIQNTQSRDAEAMHIKLDELIRAVNGASDALLDLEDLDERDLQRIRARYTALAARAKSGLHGDPGALELRSVPPSAAGQTP
jgi:low affinity Fe/Cu permease